MKEHLFSHLVVFGSFLLSFTTLIQANPIPSGVGLTIVAPTTITVPGNYRLANDIAGSLTIDADNVFIDLNNKTITGGANSISIIDHQDIEIQNGIIEGATNGILLTTCSNICIHDMGFVSNGTGIVVLSSDCIKIKGCVVKENSNDGIGMSNCTNCEVYSNVASENGSDGILLNGGNTEIIINENLCKDNATNGIRLEGTNNQNIIQRNVCNNNTSNGILLSSSNSFNIILENICSNNTGRGIILQNILGGTNTNNENTIKGNICTQNGQNGIESISPSPVSNRNTICENSCNNNGSRGIRLGDTNDNNILLNKVNSNGSFGISESSSSGNTFFNNFASNNPGSNYVGIIPAQQAPGTSPQVAGVNIDA